ncbi:hypothetical protein TNCV_326591 [Trichonephila clavipes]|nr:hypothetical protein TNCV_326591 [Trichonephila clavipes]
MSGSSYGTGLYCLISAPWPTAHANCPINRNGGSVNWFPELGRQFPKYADMASLPGMVPRRQLRDIGVLRYEECYRSHVQDRHTN